MPHQTPAARLDRHARARRRHDVSKLRQRDSTGDPLRGPRRCTEKQGVWTAIMPGRPWRLSARRGGAAILALPRPRRRCAEEGASGPPARATNGCLSACRLFSFSSHSALAHAVLVCLLRLLRGALSLPPSLPPSLSPSLSLPLQAVDQPREAGGSAAGEGRLQRPARAAGR